MGFYLYEIQLSRNAGWLYKNCVQIFFLLTHFYQVQHMWVCFFFYKNTCSSKLSTLLLIRVLDFSPQLTKLCILAFLFTCVNGQVKAQGNCFLKVDFCLEQWEIPNADLDNRMMFCNQRNSFLFSSLITYSLFQRIQNLCTSLLLDQLLKIDSFFLLHFSFSKALSNSGIYLTLLGVCVHAVSLFNLI